MKVSVLGIWHLGAVTSACLADAGHVVVGVDEDSDIIGKLNSGTAPLFEPGLNDLIKRGINSKNLSFKGVEKLSFIDSALVWVTYDTPVDDDDSANVDFVIEKIINILPFLSQGTVVLISSQLPVGSVARLEKYANDNYYSLHLKFACSPENLRLGQAIRVFFDPDRVIIGIRSDAVKPLLLELFHDITDKIEWMSIESAEMTKHAINAFLATSITFTNELATICECVGANAKEVERGLKTEVRIGSNAYVSPGGPFGGGTLARDIGFLSIISSDNGLITPVISSVRESNNEHKNWAQKKLKRHFVNLHNKVVAVWGLTYKPGTNTLRRSPAVELCNWILSEGGTINVFDPVVEELPRNWGNDALKYSSGKDAIKGADILVVGTEWPELKQIALDITAVEINNMLVIDPNGFLKNFLADKAMKYYVVGEIL